ncbi:hypothetical protein Asppvi_001669 [Aspergillus pseudoviridinutans]|uniref:Uncharacterized protein n=1 Tax=Aspergillus pseudoviridinutans TaxID=1517512 RepID=A0A9P3B3V0_9EURO|nr:uncharacterized protein Asppvi_001669 [Aspergillus pseudoviridinutans]GIJ83150.1 hypothetical protein Asppvi_001669 [Aspergillus pseudoviridinutans]
MSETGKLHDTSQSSSRRRSQSLTDRETHQEGDGPPKWEKAGDQTTSNPELFDFLARVSSINGLDSTRYIGGKNRKGS